MSHSGTELLEILDFIFDNDCVLRICKAKGVSNEFEEIQQSTAVRIYELHNRRKLEIFNVPAFIRGVVLNVIHEHRRKQRKSFAFPLDAAAEEATFASDEDSLSDDLRSFVWLRLSEKERSLAELLMAPHSIHDVALRLSTSVINAHKCKSRLRKSVMAILASCGQ